MRDQTRPGISKEEAERLRDLDSIPGFAEMLPQMLKTFGLSGVEVTDAFAFQEQPNKIPEDELLDRIHKILLREKDPAVVDRLFAAWHIAGAINRHDSLQAGERFKPVDQFEPIPWIWITGEPNTERNLIVRAILEMCPERSFDQSRLFDCELADQQAVLEKLFGSYFDPDRSNEEHTPMLVQMDAGFLLFYKAEKLSLMFQKKLVRWRDACWLRAFLHEGTVKTADDEISSVEMAETPRIVKDLKQEIERSDVAMFFIADRSPWELVEQGLVIRELVSGAIHIPVPPLRECPKLMIERLRSLIYHKPTLKSLDPDPMKYWSKEALEVVSSFHWPDNLAGLRGLVDTLFFKGVLRSGKERIMAYHVRAALSEMYGPISLLTPEPPVQTGSNEFEPPLDQQPQRKLSDISDDELRNAWDTEYKDKPGGKTLMAEELVVDLRNLRKRLSNLGCKSGVVGRPKKRA